MIWTVDAQPGVGGRAIAEQLADAAEVPLIDEQFTNAVARELGVSEEAGRVYEYPYPRALRYGASIGFVGTASLLAVELRRFEQARRSLGRLASEAARSSCVIYGRCGYALLAAHPSAVHAFLWAPFDWRLERTSTRSCVNRAAARRSLRRADRRRDRFVDWIVRGYESAVAPTLTCDVSRLRVDVIVDTLLAAGGCQIAAKAPSRTLPAVRQAG